jgi:hypothetical protein
MYVKKGAIMADIRRIIPTVGILFVIGMIGLIRFSPGVRSVDVVGLSGAGFALGVAFAFLFLAISGRLKPRNADDAK